MAIDYILTNCFTERVLKTGILKSDISDIFLSVSWFCRPQLKGQTKQLLFIRKYLTQNQLNYLR